MLTHLVIAVITFVVTNMDDLLILSVYFASSRYKTVSVVVGQYTGIVALIVFSLAGLVVKEIAAPQFVSLMGIIPLALGVKDLIALRGTNEDKNEQLTSKSSRVQWLSVALVTIANGGDNIGVYAPLFANVNQSQIAIYILSFLILTGIWCALAYWLVGHPFADKIFSQYGQIILPIFLIILGAAIRRDFVVWILP